MSSNDPLASALSKIDSAERVGKDIVVISPVSKQVKSVLSILNESRYLGAYEISETGKDMELNLIHTINRVGAIKPRFSFQSTDYEDVEKQYLPGKGFGIIIVTTSKGIMVHSEAIKKGIGGKFLAYCY